MFTDKYKGGFLFLCFMDIVSMLIMKNTTTCMLLGWNVTSASRRT